MPYMGGKPSSGRRYKCLKYQLKSYHHVEVGLPAKQVFPFGDGNAKFKGKQFDVSSPVTKSEGSSWWI